VERILKDELGFNNEQTGKFLQLRRDQQEKVRMLNQKIHETKKQMFDEVLQDNPHPTLSDSLLNITQEKQAQIEKLTYNYFLELKKLCNPQQRKKLQVLMHEVFAPRPSGNEPGRRPLPPPNGQSPPGPPPERK
jgi:protein CpxP